MDTDQDNSGVIHARMAGVFNEWARRYAEDPASFGEVLDKDGKPITDYGAQCATYFTQIAGEMDAKGQLPRL